MSVDFEKLLENFRISLIKEKEFKDQLIADNTELKRRVTLLENKVTALWYAPGAPGFFEAEKEHENFRKEFKNSQEINFQKDDKNDAGMNSKDCKQ